MGRYLPGDVEREAREAIRTGIPVAVIASRLGWDEDSLRGLLGLDSLPAAAAVRTMAVVDLWAE